ncbi:DUF2514 family protein [Methylibium sp.]|uniref:DUF2514 family protein n=1 Tax=Methylibium sp. TaxID=2067992 RepID=UPI003D0F7F5D
MSSNASCRLLALTLLPVGYSRALPPSSPSPVKLPAISKLSNHAPAGVLAELQRRADEHAGSLAHIADERGAAGTVCEHEYDALTS